jgi:hypothetical protein
MNLPPKIIHVLRSFEGVFSERVWKWAEALSQAIYNCRTRPNQELVSLYSHHLLWIP